MDTASFGGFIKTLLIIVLVYYAFKFAMRYLFPLLLMKVAKKAGQNFQERQQQQYNQYRENQSQQAKPNNSSDNQVPRSTKVVGEYIEFEEIDTK
ncbi:DUF4834 family protein [Myroides phaeus]|uniref:DUF4834 domain-containing protein n=1 Tax=Myroides phaeus TaxID=702745 RepID=A0A1G8CZ29_9FLAO|nr:DUF4834 family protein [Myroides phaeus]MEC4116209.1 DUF4834 family protein [Myroides phaeus]SDH50751.1 protein of unknown function [Myroides phaeus]